MNREGFGLFLVIGALFGLWLYATGRADAVLRIIREGAPQTLGVQPLGVGAAGGGSNILTTVAQCGFDPATGSFDVACLGDVWRGLNSPDDLWSGVGDVVGSITGGLIRL